MTKLTALDVAACKPTGTRQEILDRDGLYFIVQPSGKKSWALRYRRKSDGKAIKFTLGSYPAVSLKDARSRATELRAAIERGVDPHGDKVKARRHAVEVDQGFKAVAERFVREHQFKKNRSWEWAARRLGLEVDDAKMVEPKTCPPLRVVADGSLDMHGRPRVSLVDRWGARSCDSITRADVIAVLDEVGARAPVLANRLHSVLGKLFKWVDAKGISVNANVCSNIESFKETSRDRVLDDDELRKVWIAAGDLGHPYTGIIHLLILTGQRRNEIADLRWSEIDLEEKALHLPAARTKNKHPHDVPLSAQALHAIASVPRRIDAERIFTVRQHPVALHRVKERLDANSGVRDWVWHDLRRTVASGLQRLGVRLEVTEAVLNHRSGSMAGIVGVYQRHDYATEKRAALQRWADHVEGLVSGEPTESKVVRMARN